LILGDLDLTATG